MRASAALLATLTVGTLRNRRRALASPAEQADAANQALQAHVPDQFVTGLLMRIRLADGSAEIVNAGHPAPFLLRGGAVTPLELTTQLPLGLATAAYHADTVLLQPGDSTNIVLPGNKIITVYDARMPSLQLNQSTVPAAKEDQYFSIQVDTPTKAKLEPFTPPGK